MRTRYWVALPVAFALTASATSDAQERTEQELIELIVRDGPQAHAIRAAADVVMQEQAARLTFPNPSASYTREGAGATEFLLAEQPLPAFGLRGTLRRAGLAARQAAEAERDARLWQLRIDGLSLIARLRSESERRDTAVEAVGLVERLIGVLATREREGEGSKFDRLRAEQELVDTRQLVVTASIGASEAFNALAALLPAGVAVPERLAERPAAPLDLPMEALVARAVAGRAELRALRSAAERFGVEADVARRSQRPAPVIAGGLKRADNGGTMEAGGVVTVTLNVPLFNSGTREAARWNVERLRVEAEGAAIESEVRARIAHAARVLALRQEAVTAAGQSLSSADELMTIADVAYREGDIGILELLDGYRTAIRARQRAIEARLDLSRAQIALEGAVGVTLWP